MTDMYKIFNCGIGYVFIVSKDESDQLRHAISNEGFNSYLIGGILKKTNKEDLIYI
jgi:phosphoribosylaminoimidazole (AIR) synthetase